MTRRLRQSVVDPSTLVSGSRQECRLSFCTLWTERTDNPFCKGHMTRWRNVGFPDLEEFIAGCERYGKAFTDFHTLSPQLKLELPRPKCFKPLS